MSDPFDQISVTVSIRLFVILRGQRARVFGVGTGWGIVVRKKNVTCSERGFIIQWDFPTNAKINSRHRSSSVWMVRTSLLVFTHFLLLESGGKCTVMIWLLYLDSLIKELICTNSAINLLPAMSEISYTLLFWAPA